MNIYWVIVEIEFKEPLATEGQSDAEGFIQSFGCTDISEDKINEVITSFLKNIEWLESLISNIKFDISVIDPDDVEAEIFMDDDIDEQLESSPYEKGIWYQSGKAFFHNDDTDENIYSVEVVPYVH